MSSILIIQYIFWAEISKIIDLIYAGLALEVNFVSVILNWSGVPANLSLTQNTNITWIEKII